MRRLLVAAVLLAGAAPVAPLPGQTVAPARRALPARTVGLCIVDAAGALREVSAPVDPATGQPAALPPGVREGQYAPARGWQAITFGRARYETMGAARVIRADALRRVGWYQGRIDSRVARVAVFGAVRDGSLPRLVYLPLRRGCVFQPYAR